MSNTDQKFMGEALKQAEQAVSEGEIPVGAVVVCRGQVIARAHNQVERLQDPTAHAEMIAITSAANYLQSKFLDGCTLYVTLEPCPMCRAAIAEARLEGVVFGAPDNTPPGRRRSVNSRGGILEEACRGLLDDFFKSLRG